MSDRFKVSSLLARRLRMHQVSVSAVLRRADLPPNFLNQEKIYATTSQLFALWKAIGETSGDAEIGLKLGADAHFEHYDATQLTGLCSRTFRDALQRIARYKILTCPEEIRVSSQAEETTVEIALLRGEGAEPDILIEVCLSWILAIGQRGTDGQIKPLRLELARPVQHREKLDKHFGCPVRFKAKRNALVFRSRDLDRPFTTHNQELLEMIETQLDKELQARQAPASSTAPMLERNQIISLCRLRSSLEAFAVLQLRQRGEWNGTRERLEPVLSRLRFAAERSDFPTFHKADLEFHRTLVDKCGQPCLTKCWEIVATEADKWILQMQQGTWPSLMALYRDHLQFIEELSGDSDRVAEDACHHHLEAGWNRVAAMQEDPAFPADPVGRATSFLSTHYASVIKMSSLARDVSHVSLGHFNRVFRSKMKMAPSELLRRIRLERGAALLRSTNDPVAVIAAGVGYRSCSHFVRHFRKEYGCTPLVYRRRPIRRTA